jgi:aerobic-type carbon monoxide dehydrogenase small subunit (CoxS/CutS family)
LVRSPVGTPVGIELNVNGHSYSIQVDPRRTLLDTLRVDLGLTGTKKGCDMGECGACTVIIDGKAAYSCLVLAIECEDHKITTIEGLASGAKLHPVQQAFVERDAFQCGFCTPGQIMSVKALLDRNPHPTQEEIRTAVSGNLCRCGSYLKIFEAARAASEAYRSAGNRPPGEG